MYISKDNLVTESYPIPRMRCLHQLSGRAGKLSSRPLNLISLFPTLKEEEEEEEEGKEEEDEQVEEMEKEKKKKKKSR